MGRSWVLTARAGRIAVAVAVATVAPIVAGLSGCGSGSGSGADSPAAPDYRTALAGAPRPIAALYDQADELLPGGTPAFERRLDELRGHPVVVNKWASWCGPCREEFPFFQRLSARLGKRIAFLGVDSNDSHAAAKTFLGEFPVPYPSYSDPDQGIARFLRATLGFPATVFYDSQGNPTFVKQGQYPSEAALAADIRRYSR
jgi:cytochrome c biogenesis protein CcmG, thiol:disulfide interchange protein DsbE